LVSSGIVGLAPEVRPDEGRGKMEHETIEAQVNPETGEFVGYPAWTRDGYPVTTLGVVLDCQPPCEKCAARMAEIRERYEAEMGEPLSDYEASYLGDADEQERRAEIEEEADAMRKADLENGPDWAPEVNGRGWPISRTERDCGA
jgi:hypothetical protein